jgi:predicted O-methyltransferase YrrM
MKPKTQVDVFHLMGAFVDSAALNAALGLGLFWRLAERPQTAAEVGQALGIPGNRSRYWMNVLVGLGLLTCDDDGVYALTETARAAILDTFSHKTWAHLATEWREHFPIVQNLTEHICDPRSPWDVQGIDPLTYMEKMVEDPGRAASFTRMLYEDHLDLAEKLARRVDMSGAHRILDVGGGSGVVSFAFLERYPDLTSVVVDIENVCMVGREIAAERGLADRISYNVADFLSDAFPGELAGQFDVVMYCDAGPNSEAMFRKLGEALKPGGQLIIVDRMLAAGQIPRAPLVHWMFCGAMEEPDYDHVTVEDIRERLRKVGFEIVSEAVFTDFIDEEWTVIEVCKAERFTVPVLHLREAI